MKNIAWFGIAGSVLAIALIVRSPFMAFALYAFLLLVIVANFTSRAWLAGLDCERTISQTTLQQGEETEVEVTLTNRRGWPIPWIFVEDLKPQDFLAAGENKKLAILMPGRALTLRYRLLCHRRGYHRVGPLMMESGDLFGLQKRFRTGEQQDYISVLPTVAYIEAYNIAARRPQGPVRIANRVYEDPTRIAGLREYVPGDPLSRIHWKASARAGELYVKQTEHSSVTGATLILDVHELGYQGEHAESRLELAITTTASIAYLLQMSGEQLGMLTNGRDAAEIAKYDVASQQALSRVAAHASVVGEDTSDRLTPLTVPTARTPMQARKIIENLARILPTDGLDAANLVLSEFRRLPRDAAMLPVVPSVSEELALVLASMKQSGFAVSVFLIDNNANYAEAASFLAPHGIHVFHIENERDLHEISPTRIGH